jgi:hypothetical protein
MKSNIVMGCIALALGILGCEARQEPPPVPMNPTYIHVLDEFYLETPQGYSMHVIVYRDDKRNVICYQNTFRDAISCIKDTPEIKDK